MKKLWSVFTDDMDHCYFTGSAPIERHHIFGGANRKISEKYGFVIPLRPDLHPNGVFAGEDAHRMDINLKQMAQNTLKIITAAEKTSGEYSARAGYRVATPSES